MLLYAERPDVRTRQVAVDVAVVAGVLLLGWAGIAVHDAVAAFAGPAAEVGEAAAEVASTLEGVEAIPIIGPALAIPLGGIATGSRELEAAAAAQAEQVLDAALAAGVLVALLPSAWLVWRWLRSRVGWSQEASAAAALRDAGADLRVLALRAVARGSLAELVAVTGGGDPWADLVAGRVQPLVDRELRRLGLRERGTLPGSPAAAGDASPSPAVRR